MTIKKVLHLVNDERKLASIKSAKACSIFVDDTCTQYDDPYATCTWGTKDRCTYDMATDCNSYSADLCYVDN
jgi:hypothetical protein